ncbi:MAG: arabinofuranosidase catalytic domain-containing protein [Pseudomonadota bacterium]
MEPSSLPRNTAFGLALALTFTIATAGCSSSGGAKGGAGGSPGSGGAVGLGGRMGSGGSGAGGTAAGGPLTTLTGSRSLGSLSSAEATQLCNDTYAYYARAISQATLCKEAGLAFGVSSSAPTDAQLQHNCQSQEAACLAAAPAVPSCSSIPASCPATVTQYTACISDQVAAFNAGVSALASCAAVKTSDLPSVWTLVAGDPPGSCAPLDACGGFDIPTPHAGMSSSGAGGTGGTPATGGSGGAGGAQTGSGGTAHSGGASGTAGGGGGRPGTGGAGGATAASGLPGDVAKAAGTPFVAAHAMTRALFAGYAGPLFKALRVSDKQEKDIGTVAATGVVDVSALSTFCAGTSCKVTTLYDQSGNGNDMWRADDPATNQPGTVKPCDLMDIQYWPMSDGTKVPVAVESGAMWKSTAQCLRNRDKTKNMPTGAKAQTEYAIFHGQYLNNNCCFNYGNTGNAVHYSGPGTLSALNFSKITFWSQGTGSGPWPMVDFETGVYAGNTAKCGSGVPSSVACTSSGQNPNPSVTFDIVTTLFKHNGTNHWALKTGNAKAGALSVNIDLSALPTGYSPLKQEGGLGLGEGGAGDSNGTGGFSEGAVISGETTDATDDAIQKSIVSVYGK